jgi:hypothetical protein
MIQLPKSIVHAAGSKNLSQPLYVPEPSLKVGLKNSIQRSPNGLPGPFLSGKQ